MQLLVSPQKMEQFQQAGSNESLAPECPVHQRYWQSDQINHLEDYNRGSLNSLKDRSKVLISVTPCGELQLLSSLLEGRERTQLQSSVKESLG